MALSVLHSMQRRRKKAASEEDERLVYLPEGEILAPGGGTSYLGDATQQGMGKILPHCQILIQHEILAHPLPCLPRRPYRVMEPISLGVGCPFPLITSQCREQVTGTYRYGRERSSGLLK